MAWQEIGGANTNPLTLNHWLGTGNPVPLIIRTQGTEVMRITPNARNGTTGVTGDTRLLSVGIGTAQPKAKLHVNSSDQPYPAIHAGGSSASLSFASQDAPDFIPDGQDGNRWVWEAYRDSGSAISNARLWSRGDRLIITGTHGQVLVNNIAATAGRDLSVDYPAVPIGRLTPNPPVTAPPPSLPASGELVLGGVRTSLRGFDGEIEDSTRPDGLSLRLGYHWIRTNGHESELWMGFQRGRPTGRYPLVRVVRTPVAWYGPQFNSTSDERTKTNIQQVEGALEKLERIRGVAFEWAEPQSPYAPQGVPGQRNIGVIAQEVEEAFPELVPTYEEDQEYKAVDNLGLTSVLIEAVKELKAQNEELRSRVDALERE
jgi:hypothetical protein